MAVHFSILGGSSTKEKIIELLSQKWPQTTKKLYKNLLKHYRLSITYQAAHKALKELTENKVLEKTKQGYLLNKDWIFGLGDFSEKIKSELDHINKKREIKTIHKLTFNSHSEFIKFHIGFIEEIIRKEKKLDMIFYFRHIPYPNVLSREEIAKLKPLLRKIKWSIFAKNKTPLDQWCSKYWKGLGINVKVGQDIPTNSMLIIANNYLTHIYLSRKAIKEWDKIFSIKSPNNVDINRMTETILEKKYKTTVTILKDKELVSLLVS